MILDNFQNWQTVWEQDYVAQTPAMMKNGYSARLIIGQIIVPINLSSNIISIGITNTNRNSGYIGYVQQKVSGTFSAYVCDSYRPFYLSGQPNIFIFNQSISSFLVSFTPIPYLQTMHLEVFEFLGS